MKNKICTGVWGTLCVACTCTLFTACQHSDSSELQQELPDKKHITARVGDTISIKLHQNGSTGMVRCWLNPEDCKTITLLDKRYRTEGDLRCEGCGVTETYVFRATGKGVSVFKTGIIVPHRTGRNCENFKPKDVRDPENWYIEVR